MKKLLIILLVLFCAASAFSQTPTKFNLPYDSVLVRQLTRNSHFYVKGTGFFTDTVTVTTMDNSDSSNRAASTAFVKRNSGAGTTYTANNGITLTGTNFQWGGTLIQPTTINSSFNDIVFDSVSSELHNFPTDASSINPFSYTYFAGGSLSLNGLPRSGSDTIVTISANNGAAAVNNYAELLARSNAFLSQVRTDLAGVKITASQISVYNQIGVYYDSISLSRPVTGAYDTLNLFIHALPYSGSFSNVLAFNPATGKVGYMPTSSIGSLTLAPLTGTASATGDVTSNLLTRSWLVTGSTGPYGVYIDNLTNKGVLTISQVADQTNIGWVKDDNSIGSGLQFGNNAVVFHYGTGTFADAVDGSANYISRSFVDSAFVGRVANKFQPIGVVVTSAFPGPAIPSGFVQTTGAATISYSSGLNISGGNGNRSNNFVKSTYYSYSNNYQILSEFVVNTKPFFDTDGLQTEKLSSSNIPLHLYATFKKASLTTARLTLTVVNGSGNGTLVDSTTTITLANTNKYRVIVTQSNNTVYFRVSLLVAGVETEVADKLYTVPINTNFVLPNVGSVGVGVLGGSYTVTLLQQTDYDVVYSDVLVIGTSITQGYFPTSIENHYLSKAFKGTNKRYINYGVGGNTFLDITNAGLTEIYAAHPVAVGLELGVNDVCADIRTYAPAIIDSLQAHGIDVFWIQDFTNTCKDSVIFNICKEQGIPLFAPGKTMTSDMFNGDLVHPNDLGFSYMAKDLKGNGPQYFGTTGGVDQYSYAGLKDVKLTAIANGDIPVWNSTTLQWNNSTGGGSFIQNQTSTSQLAGFKISGYGQATGFHNGGITNNEYLHFENNISDGEGIYLKNLSGGNFVKIFPDGTNGHGVGGWATNFITQSLFGIVQNAFGGPFIVQTNSSNQTRFEVSQFGQTQVGYPAIGTFCTACAFEVQTTIATSKPYPIMTTAQRNAIASVQAGDGVYCSDCTASDASTGVITIWNGSAWKNSW